MNRPNLAEIWPPRAPPKNFRNPFGIALSVKARNELSRIRDAKNALPGAPFARLTDHFPAPRGGRKE